MAAIAIAKETIIVDNVIRYPPSGLKIVIVGTGPAGLLAAIECWRKGHDVEVLEKSPIFSSIGDAFGIGPSAWSTLRYYPSMAKEYAEVAVDTLVTPCYLDGRYTGEQLEFEYNREGSAEHAAYPIRVIGTNGRADIAKILLNQCERLGISVTRGVNIVDYADENGSGIAIADDGKRYQADLIVAADGIGSKSCKLILGEPLLRQNLAKGGRPEVRLYAGHNRHIIAIISARLVSFALTLPDESGGIAQESWSSTISSEELLARIPDTEHFDPLMIELIKNFPKNKIVAWKLCMRNPQPKWSSEGGHVVQVGDSAHSYIPTSGNGATMALEDAMSLAECLRLGGKKDLALAVEIHQLLRHQRATLVQRVGLLNRATLHQDREDTVMDVDRAIPMGKWLWGHNPERYVTENFRKAREHIETGAPFENTNLPPGHKPETWTLEGEVEKEKKGRVLDPRENGDWGVC